MTLWKTFFWNLQKRDSLGLHYSSGVHAPIQHTPSRCSVFVCRSAMLPGGGSGTALVKSASVLLTRSASHFFLLIEKSFCYLVCMFVYSFVILGFFFHYEIVLVRTCTFDFYAIKFKFAVFLVLHVYTNAYMSLIFSTVF